MNILDNEQVKRNHFNVIGGFPEAKNIKNELKEYNGEEDLCIACTQLDSHRDYWHLTARERKKILQDWIDFLTNNPTAIKRLHFNSHVPQALFNAACCRQNLVELRCKWGNYPDLTPLEKLDKLNFLYLGGGRVKDITPITKLRNLAVLELQGFRQVEDYSPLTALDKLEQLVIFPTILSYIPMQDLEFLRDMPNLRAFSTHNVTLRRKYTRNEIAALRADLPHLLRADLPRGR